MASATTLQAATQAVQRDAAGDAPSAIVFYEQAAEGLVADCAAIGAGPEVDAMRAKRDEYLARARVLRAQSAMPDAAGGGPQAARDSGGGGGGRHCEYDDGCILGASHTGRMPNLKFGAFAR